VGPRFHPGALADFTEAHEWYLDVDIEVAAAFRRALEQAIDGIQANPERWPLQRNGARAYRVGSFPYSIHYSQSKEQVTIIALAHHRRRPGWFSKRLAD
jgi:plasmid stabilization system protein ParE